MKLSRVAQIGILALVASICVSGSPVRGQQAPSAPDLHQQSSEPQRVTPGRELAHESREAAGEEKDEFEQFKHSSSVQIISRITGWSLQQSYWACMFLNFVVIAWAIIWAGRKFLPGIFRDRTAAIQRAMQEAQKASEEARAKLAEIESRLQKLDIEIGAMRDAAEREGGAEEKRIQAAAEEDARKIVAAAELEIAAAAKTARRQLTAHAADLAVGLAQKQIHVDAATDQGLVRNFAAQLGSTENSGKDRN
jgi:F-type H+-transporting ATPase subunit b